MLVTSALTAGGGDTERQKSSSFFTPFLGEPRTNNGSFLSMGMQNKKKGRASQRIERPVMLVNCVCGTFHRKRFLHVLFAYNDKFMFNINRSHFELWNLSD